MFLLGPPPPFVLLPDPLRPEAGRGDLQRDASLPPGPRPTEPYSPPHAHRPVEGWTLHQAQGNKNIVNYIYL